MKCNQCDNGLVIVEENGRMIRDACYHCGMSENVSEELHRLDRLREVAFTLASMEIDNLIYISKDWNLLASENMMPVIEYTRLRVYESEFRITNQLIEMAEWKQELFIKLNEIIHGISMGAEAPHRRDNVDGVSQESEDDIPF